MGRVPEYDTVVVGGGFFGCALALHAREKQGRTAVVIEMREDTLQRASYVNQARIHNGYHYPRSLLTALRCRVDFPRFIQDFNECVVDDFDKYYAIGRKFGKVTAEQYRRFCDRIGAPIEEAPDEIQALFNPDLIEAVFSVRECAFDPEKLNHIIRRRLSDAGVEILFRTEARGVRPLDDDILEVSCSTPEGERGISGRSVLNCTYSRINKLLVDSGLPRLYLKHELTEMALVEVPEELAHRGVTVMCGPFFSIMPFPPRGLHSLSHVRYTPHFEWKDEPGTEYVDAYECFDRTPKKSHGLHMIKDAARYMPCLEGCRQVDSLWEVKTVLPKSELDDSRPVLFASDWGLPNLTCLMGGKIDNIYDIIEFGIDAYERTGAS